MVMDIDQAGNNTGPFQISPLSMVWSRQDFTETTVFNRKGTGDKALIFQKYIISGLTAGAVKG